jgi:head-tail adaptor
MVKRSNSGIWGDTRIDPGEMTEPIYIMKMNTTKAGDGGDFDKNFETESDPIWAKEEPGSGREVFIGESETAIARIKFSIYYREDLTAQDRIKRGNEELRIIKPPENVHGRNTYQIVTCDLLNKDN